MREPDEGWLQLQRERFHLESSYQFAPPNRVSRLDQVMPEVLKGMGLESASRVSELGPVWEDLVGRANAKHSRPGRWERGVLTVYVDHNVWLAEMKRFGARTILKRVRGRFGEASVTELRFQIDPGDES
jgi:predicted nucleic acid-binding Zn ribbon protein